MSLPASASFRALGTHASVLVTEPTQLPRERRSSRMSWKPSTRHAAASATTPSSPRSTVPEVTRSGSPTSSCRRVEVAVRAAEVTGGAVDPTVGRAMRAIGYDRDFDQIAFHSRELEAVRASAPRAGGAVDVDRANARVRVPSGVELDLGATAKALAADRAAQRIAAETGVRRAGQPRRRFGDRRRAPRGAGPCASTDDHAAELGGAGPVDLSAGGADSPRRAPPFAAGMGRPGRSTTSSIRRLANPPRQAWRTVSVAAAACVDANVASTATIVGGEAALSWLRAATAESSRSVARAKWSFCAAAGPRGPGVGIG